MTSLKALKALKSPISLTSPKALKVYKPPAKGSEHFSSLIAEYIKKSPSDKEFKGGQDFIAILKEFEDKKVEIKDLYCTTYPESEATLQHRARVRKLMQEGSSLPWELNKEWILFLDSHKVYYQTLGYLLDKGPKASTFFKELSEEYLLNIFSEPKIILSDKTDYESLINHRLILAFLYRHTRWAEEDIRRTTFAKVCCDAASLSNHLGAEKRALRS